AEREVRAAGLDAEQQRRGTVIPVGNPQVATLDRGQNLGREASLLRMGVFTRKHVDHELQPRIKNHRAMAWQRCGVEFAKFLDPPLRATQMVGVQYLHAIPW